MSQDTQPRPRHSGPNANTRLAYDALRDGIGSGELAGGEWLRENSLAADLGLSRTPVREALRMLATEGVVELVHNRGARVIRWTAEDIDEVYRLRAVLEAQGAAMAARRADATQVAELNRLENRFEALLADGGSPDEVARCNLDLHRAIVDCAASPRLTVLLDVISSTPLVTRAMQHYSGDDRQRSIIQHRDVITAIAHRDSDLAESAMRSHILAARYAARQVAEAPEPVRRAVRS